MTVYDQIKDQAMDLLPQNGELWWYGGRVICVEAALKGYVFTTFVEARPALDSDAWPLRRWTLSKWLDNINTHYLRPAELTDVQGVAFPVIRN